MKPEPTPAALKLIIAYKFARAAASVVAALVLVGLSLAGVATRAQAFVRDLHEHAVVEVSLEVTSLALSALAPQHLWVVLGAVLLDAVMIFAEGWALLRKWAWGAWLVVVASGVALPFEVVAIVRHLNLTRVALLVLNSAIVAYLLVRTLRQRASKRLTGQSP